MRIGLFGGTFDPPHHGHLLAASDAFEALALDRLIWIPAAEQPLKQGTQSASAADRLAMVRLLVGDDARFAVDPIEIERAGLSYTVETVEALRGRFPGDELVLLLGTDVLATFARWREPRRIASLARVALLHRAVDGGAVEKAAVVGAVRAVTGDDLPAPVVLDTRRVDVSSTEIRERARDGRSLHGYVPDAVARYVREHALYR
ncbi:MAG TPA: nicotinate (nicotinamide) nucleotide adenylyltransferase [Gemmatimonadaceae bacterium]|nr:nicotinate (nicotinamide) nucleotide adenylyltransferase [Gemmatimonadaceae bacterium]